MSVKYDVWTAAQETQFLQRLRSKLDLVIDGDAEDYHQIVRDTIEGETDVENIVTKLLNGINETDAIIEGRAIYIDKLTSANKAGKAFIARTRELLKDCLEAACRDSVKTLVGTVSVTDGKPQVIVENEFLIPTIYHRTVVDQEKLRADVLAVEKVRAEILADQTITEEQRADALALNPSIPGVRVEAGDPSIRITKPRGTKDKSDAPKAAKPKAAKAA